MVQLVQAQEADLQEVGRNTNPLEVHRTATVHFQTKEVSRKRSATFSYFDKILKDLIHLYMSIS